MKRIPFIVTVLLSACIFFTACGGSEDKKEKEEELDGAITYLQENKEEIKRKRIEAGIQDKY